jgi:hypothetical protein
MSRVTGVWMVGTSVVGKVLIRDKEFRTFPKAVLEISILSLIVYFLIKLST